MPSGSSSRSVPLSPGAVSLRLYPHDLPPAEVVAELMAQAGLAEAAGFDGVMTSEHHGGFPNYLPNPLLAATWALEATERAWAAPCPLLLPLRPVGQVVEDLAWTAQRFPGRVGAGFAAGALADDFVVSDVPFEEMRERFRAALPIAVAGLRGHADGPLAADPAVAALQDDPVPLVSAAQSPAAARRAGALGIGLLFDSLISTERAAEVSAAHQEAGGGGSRILIRRRVGGAAAHHLGRRSDGPLPACRAGVCPRPLGRGRQPGDVERRLRDRRSPRRPARRRPAATR